MSAIARKAKYAYNRGRRGAAKSEDHPSKIESSDSSMPSLLKIKPSRIQVLYGGFDKSSDYVFATHIGLPDTRQSTVYSEDSTHQFWSC